MSARTSAHEIEIWKDRAALLDPRAYLVVSGETISHSVPVGQRHYLVQSFYETSNVASPRPISLRGGNRTHRLCMIPGGETIHGNNPGGVAGFTFGIPSLVTGDARYNNDPIGLYFQRLNKLETLTENAISVAMNAGDSNNANPAVSSLPDDTNQGRITIWNGQLGASSGGGSNQNEEISDVHSTTNSSCMLFPFFLLPAVIALEGGDFYGQPPGTGVQDGFLTGNCANHLWLELPADWATTW